MHHQRPAIYTALEIYARMQEIGEHVIGTGRISQNDVIDAINGVHEPLPVLDALALGYLLNAAQDQYYIFYTHLTDGTSHCVTCDVLEEAQMIWDMFKKLYNSYNVKSSRPAPRPQINGAQ